MSTAVASAITELVPSFSGRLIQPDDASFDEARHVHNGMIDKRPSIVARCLGSADIVDALSLALTRTSASLPANTESMTRRKRSTSKGWQ